MLGLQQESGGIYYFLKHSKQDNSGITSLKANGQTFTSDADEAYSLNQQFQSVFSPKSPTTLKALVQKNSAGST